MIFNESKPSLDTGGLMEEFPYDHAARRLIEGRITKAELLEGMKVPDKKQAQFIENRIKLVLLNRKSLYSSIQDMHLSFDERFPPSTCNEVALFKQYREYFFKITKYCQNKLGQDAFDWAIKIIDNNPETAAQICSLPEMDIHYQAAFFKIAFPSEASRSTKKTSKADDKFFTNTFRKIASSAEKMSADGLDPYGSDAVISLCNSIYGGTRTLMIMLLGNLYRCIYSYVSSIILGMYESDFTSQRRETLFDYEDVRILILESSPFKDLFGEDLFLAIEVVGFQANALSRKYAWKQHYYSLCAQDINKLLTNERYKNKELQNEIVNLNKLLSQTELKQSINNNKLKEASEVIRLRDENHKLRAELKKASDKLFLNEQNITRLKDKIVELSPSKEIVELQELQDVLSLTNDTICKPTLDENIHKLKEMRGLVVGGHQNFIAKIRRLLPEWRFYSADDAVVEEGIILDSDIVVLFTKYASHKITEKPIKICRQRNIPIIYSNHNNPSTFISNLVLDLNKLSVQTGGNISEVDCS